MRPESAALVAYNLVKLDHAMGMYRRAQMTPVDERMIIEEVRSREQRQALLPSPWSSGRTPDPRS
jgi:hypothetical protein